MRPLRDFAGGEEDLTKCRWLQPLTCSRPRASTSPRFPLNLRLQGPVLLVAMCQGGWKAWRRRLSSNLRNFSRRSRGHLINIGRLQLDIEVIKVSFLLMVMLYSKNLSMILSPSLSLTNIQLFWMSKALAVKTTPPLMSAWRRRPSRTSARRLPTLSAMTLMAMSLATRSS